MLRLLALLVIVLAAMFLSMAQAQEQPRAKPTARQLEMLMLHQRRAFVCMSDAVNSSRSIKPSDRRLAVAFAAAACGEGLYTYLVAKLGWSPDDAHGLLKVMADMVYEHEASKPAPNL
jgi:hypothetical protein